MQKSMDLYIKKAYSTLNDNYIPFSETNDTMFLILENYKSYTAKLDYYGEAFARFSLRMDLEYDIYTR